MSSALRVLMMSDVSPVEIRGGAERVLWEQASRLAAVGHKVHVLSRSPTNGVGETVERQGVRISHFPADRRSFVRFFLNSIREARHAAARELTEAGADVLHLQQPLSGFGALNSAVGRRVPSLYTFHSPAPLEYRSRLRTTAHHRGGLAGAFGIVLLWFLEGLCLRRVTRIHVLSDFSTDLLRKLYRIGPKRIVKIPGGVDTKRFRPAEDRDAIRKALGIPTGTFVLLTVRNLEPRMGLDSLVRAMAILRQQAPDLVLLVGGAGSLRSDLEALTDSLGLGGHVRFLGFIPDSELPHYYQACDAFVLPTRELEGFGLVTAEALACGTPVLGTPVGAIPEILGELQPDLLFEGTGPEAIARGILKHLEMAQANPQGFEALRQRCRDYATARFGWDQVIKQLEQELVNLTGCAERGKV
ncbi:MAG: glycosyltransferase family 4 protein [Nitrospiraceae bacterium]